jgi:uncharacterized membrane protein
MRVWLLYSCLFLLACGTKPKETTVATQATNTTVKTDTPAMPTPIADTSAISTEENTSADEPPITPTVKKPSGVYRFLLPYGEDKKILHTIAFYPASFRLQEEYPGKKDSIVITEGTWSPSEGYIWLYKDQIVRGRYTWKGDTLQYFSPRFKKNFSMHKLIPAMENEVWRTKRQEGTVLYGVGNEPFWSVEVNKHDSIVLNMPDWAAPLQMKLSATNASKDSTVYTAENDSLRVTVYPLFCNDGMSDFLYTQRVKVAYRGQSYKGCGEVWQPTH